MFKKSRMFERDEIVKVGVLRIKNYYKEERP